MLIVTIALIAAIVLGLLMRRRYRKPAHGAPKSGGRKRELSSVARNQIRRTIVKEGDYLCALEEEITHFGEGSEPDVQPDKADRARNEAAHLRSKLEAQCRRHGMPIGLVRRRRSATLNPTVGPIEKD